MSANLDFIFPTAKRSTTLEQYKHTTPNVSVRVLSLALHPDGKSMAGRS